MAKTKVLIVDDSALIRQILAAVFRSDPEIDLVGEAADPYVAWEMIKATKPDVLTLDVEMPRMDGLSFLAKLMAARPTPVVMISSLTERSCETTLRALELGAVDFITKPKLDVRRGMGELAADILDRVKGAARVRPRPRPIHGPAAVRPATSDAMIRTTDTVIAIGASTGGTEALCEVLTGLPAHANGIVIVQHMPEKFTKSFAERLDSLTKIRVREAKDGDRIHTGLALVAPGGRHMEVKRSGAEYSVRVFDGETVNRHRPSVEVLFRSCARWVGRNAVGVMLTGMGGDGAEGMAEMRRAGAYTIAQNEETCVVFGMPKVAIEKGGVEDVLPLDRIAQAIMNRTANV